MLWNCAQGDTAYLRGTVKAVPESCSAYKPYGQTCRRNTLTTGVCEGMRADGTARSEDAGLLLPDRPCKRIAPLGCSGLEGVLQARPHW